MHTFTRQADGSYFFTAQDGDLTARLVRTYKGIFAGNSIWTWEVSVCGGVIDSGRASYLRDAKRLARLTLDCISPAFID